MQHAGLAAAEFARTQVSGARLKTGGGVLVLAGPGNNGGDALEAAVHLKRWFFAVSVVFAGDAQRLPPDAAAALERWRGVGGELLAEIPRRRDWGLVIDGLFGIGLTRAITDANAKLIEQANSLGAPILALDIPSGINSETGAVMGAAIRATYTLCFIALKPGLLTLDGPDHCGRLACDDLGLALDSAEWGHDAGELIDASVLAERPPPRPRNFHKGLAGDVGVLGGAMGTVGAALLCARAALKTGAGRVLLGLVAEQALHVDSLHPELMLRRAESLLAGNAPSAIAVGPGLGTDTHAQRIVTQALRSSAPLVLDADALNLLASYHVLHSALITRLSPTILTPHPAEAGRLLGTDTRAVQADRLRAALELARRFKAHIVLKGNGSIVVSADGRWAINQSGNPGMAAAGMGDALTGIITALLAQGLPATQALRLGVYLHGAAADRCVANGMGPIGLTASEVIDSVRTLLNASITENATDG